MKSGVITEDDDAEVCIAQITQHDKSVHTCATKNGFNL